uniref:Uncharacterized protein n=1 Tax=Hyaloperonospora arabidopsidis (strain Emoy2) TaxID=559515 RepID=M4BAU3_HYAAE
MRLDFTWDSARTVVCCPLPDFKTLGSPRRIYRGPAVPRGRYGESFWGRGQNSDCKWRQMIYAPSLDSNCQWCQLEYGVCCSIATAI